MSCPRRLTGWAWLLLSGFASPAVIVLGSYVHDCGRPYIGETIVIYGVLHLIAAVMCGGYGVALCGLVHRD